MPLSSDNLPNHSSTSTHAYIDGMRAMMRLALAEISPVTQRCLARRQPTIVVDSSASINTSAIEN